ncbi:MAG TPA: hypothetical protein VJM53_07855 [Burkholderiales bacterium]|nr:hypothetical protein [Burkholderiales bacterium]
MKLMRTLIAVIALLLLSGCYEELDWREWHAEDGSFVLLLPAKPKELSHEVSIGNTRLTLHMLSTHTDGLAFGIAYADLPADASSMLLENARDALLRNIDGKLQIETPIQVGEMQGLEFQAEGRSDAGPTLMAARVLRSKQRFYQIVFIGRADRAAEVDIPFFLTSFQSQR